MAGMRTAKQKAALRKAQLASARKRRGRGKGKPVARGRRSVASMKAQNVKRRGSTSSTKSQSVSKRRSVSSVKAQNVRRNRRRAIAVVGAVGAAAAAGYVYKNREKMIVAPAAEFFAVRSAKQKAKAQGKRLGKAQIRKVRLEERKNHANRSRYRVQEYKDARDLYQTFSTKGLNLRPVNPKKLKLYEKAMLVATGNRRSLRPIGSKNSFHVAYAHKNLYNDYMQDYVYKTYRKDVNARAIHRLNRMKGKKTGFSYKSGKTKKVIAGRVFQMPI